MKKHFRFIILTLVILMLGSVMTAHAEVIPPYGEGQIGLPAVVLCGELTMRQEPSASSKAVKTLQYGALPNVMKQSDGWAYCADGDSEDSAVIPFSSAYSATASIRETGTRISAASFAPPIFDGFKKSSTRILPGKTIFLRFMMLLYCALPHPAIPCWA